MATIFRALVSSLALLVAMWAASLWVYEGEKMRDAVQWRWAELNDEPLYIWSFDSPLELTGGHGLRRFVWSEGTLTGDHPDPYFFLNLDGRNIDARRFTQLRLRLRSEDDNSLRIFFKPLREDKIVASEFVALVPGWQTVTLSLPSLDWLF
jgi:hypothetical protein